MTLNIKCVEVGGMFYPVAMRKRGQQRIDACPFCEAQHLHSSGDGHRYPHCGARGIVNIDGKNVPAERGYIIKDY